MYIDVSFPRPSSSPCLGILVYWLLIDSVLLTEPLHYPYFHLIKLSGRRRVANILLLRYYCPGRVHYAY